MIDKVDMNSCAVLRQRLAEVGQLEALLHANSEEEIEKYRSVLRVALGRRAKTHHLARAGIPYDWCGAFAYFCCLRAGFTFPPQLADGLPGTAAAVFVWKEWALLPQNRFVLNQGDEPQAGDLVIFDRLIGDNECDHIGIIVGVEKSDLITAEGNVNNTAGIFRRGRQLQVNCYIRISRP